MSIPGCSLQYKVCGFVHGVDGHFANMLVYYECLFGMSIPNRKDDGLGRVFDVYSLR